MPSEERSDSGAVDQTLNLTLQATRRRVAPVMRFHAGDWETDERKGTFAIPMTGGIVIKIEGDESEWWVSGKAILEAILRGLAGGLPVDVQQPSADPICACDHPLSVHSRDGFASCQAPGCACGPGCIHDGYVNKETGEGPPTSHSAAHADRGEVPHVR